jgi:hypothetical protein
LNSTAVQTGAGASAALPARFELQPAYPNPFNPRTTLRFGIARAGPVRISVYDTSGRLVRRLLDEPRDAGWFEIGWDGRSDGGRGVVSGVYYGRLESGGTVLQRKLLLLR